MSDVDEGQLARAVARLREAGTVDRDSDGVSDDEDRRQRRNKFSRERHRSQSPRDFGRGFGPRPNSSSPSPHSDANQYEEHLNASEFAQFDVPPAPRRLNTSARQLIVLSEEHRAQFEEWARGKFLSTAERTTLLADLPVPDSPFAFAPVVDTELRGIAKESRRTDRVEVFTQDVDTAFDLTLNSINILAIVKALGNREDLVIPGEVMDYLNLQGELLGALIKMGIGWKREALTKQLGIPRSAIPSLKNVEINSTPTTDRDGSLRSEIFGKILRDELLTADNPTRKAIDRLKASSSARKTTNRKSQFATGRVDKYQRRSSGPQEDRNRCRLFRAAMVGPLRLRLSSVFLDPEGDQESGGRRVSPTVGDPVMANPTLVSSRLQTCSEESSRSQIPGTSGDRSARGTAPSPKPEIFHPSRMGDLPKWWGKKGLSPQAVSSILASWAPSTRKQYDSVLKSWFNFSPRVDKAPTDVEVCNYLASLKEKGLAFSSIASHKAAISSFSEVLWGTSFSESPILIRFMKGLFREKPSKPKYSETWEVDKVFDFIRGWGPNKDLSLKDITHKVTFLLALCSPRRVSELANLSLRSVQKFSDHWKFFLDYRNKNRSAGPAHTAIYARFPSDLLLCPVDCLEIYIEKSLGIRKDTDTLLVSVATGKQVSPETISRWIKAVLSQAGIDKSFGAHSTRSASTSKAFLEGTALSSILDAACWSKKSDTFRRFYNRPIADLSFQGSILSRSSASSRPGPSRAPPSSAKGQAAKRKL